MVAAPGCLGSMMKAEIKIVEAITVGQANGQVRGPMPAVPIFRSVPGLRAPCPPLMPISASAARRVTERRRLRDAADD
jgi:hypothetical protein